MCGIAGIVRITPADRAAQVLERPLTEVIPESWLDTLDEGIKYRGPDGQGRFRDRAVRCDGCVVDVALVHRRLSIIDLQGGAQPMVSARSHGARGASDAVGSSSIITPASERTPSLALGAPTSPLLFHGPPDAPVRYTPVEGAGENLVACVFNGCIYNHRELRAELEQLGHVFETDHSDTEVLLHGWREWNTRLPEQLDGMFACAIWDQHSATLTLLRDLAGEKPLHWMELGDQQHGNVLYFSSNAGTLARLGDALVGDAGSDVDPGIISCWLKLGAYGRPPSYALCTLVPAGCAQPQDWAGGGYFDLGWGRLPTRNASPALTLDMLDALLDKGVASRLESDVPLGCLLSGGVDSSLVAFYARRHLGTLRTYTLRMPDARFDESPFAQRVADHLGTQHTTLECHPDAANDLVGLIGQIGLPLGDSSLLPTYWVCRAAREQVRVALTGDGGDELFGGYDRYAAARWLRAWGWLLRRMPTGMFARAHPSSPWAKLERLINAARGDGYADLLRIFSSDELARLELRVHNRSGTRPLLEPGSDKRFDPAADPLLYDFVHSLPQDLLCKVDSASMGVALETRAPLLAREIVRACLSEPIRALMPGGQRKALLRALARRHLPAIIAERPKQGFAIPIGAWFRTDFGGMKTLLLDQLHSVEPFGPPALGIDLNRAFIETMIREHMDELRDHSQRLYVLLVLSIWARSMQSS